MENSKDPVKATEVAVGAAPAKGAKALILSLLVLVAIVGGVWLYLTSLVPKGDPEFQRAPATQEENVTPKGAMPQAPGM